MAAKKKLSERHVESAFVNALDLKPHDIGTDQELPTSIMFMPAGDSTITPSVNGEAKQISVNVSQRTAHLLQGELDSLLLENVRPYIDFNHEGRTAAAIPKKFVWKDEGVMLEVDWTNSGKSAVGGRDYSYFSPAFLLNDNGEPVGLPKSGAIGSLVNNPAFRTIKRIAANNGAEGTEEIGDNIMTEEEISALRTELETVRAENKELKAKLDAQKVESNQSEIEALKAENKTLKESAEALKVEAANKDADQLIEAAIRDHKIGPKDETVKASIKKYILSDIEGGKSFIESLPVNPAFGTVVKITAASKDVGKAPLSKDTNASNSNSGKLCEAKVAEVQSRFPGMTWEKAWNKAALESPELFAGANV
jgi:hypothetical protein